MRDNTRPRTQAYTHELTHARARTHKHTQKYVILMAFALQKQFRENSSMLTLICVAPCIPYIASNSLKLFKKL